jgi:hypothetical protein
MSYYYLEQGQKLCIENLSRPFTFCHKAEEEAKALKRRTGKQYTILEISRRGSTQESGEVWEGKGW